jgi:hypothetical protein
MTGVLLIVAGAVKLAPMREIALFHWLVLPPMAVVATGAMEFALGCLVLSFSPRSAVYWATVAMFAIYIGVLCLQLYAGESTCNCLGAQSLPVVWMLALDGGLLAAALVLRRWWRHSVSNRSASAVGELFSAMRFALPVLALAGVAALGSFESALSYLTGARLIAASPTLHAGDIVDGQTAAVTFKLTNYGSKSIHIAGAKATCKCLAWDDLPMTIEPKESRQITIRVRGRAPAPRVQRESAYLISDDGGPIVSLTATACVLPPLPLVP